MYSTPEALYRLRYCVARVRWWLKSYAPYTYDSWLWYFHAEAWIRKHVEQVAVILKRIDSHSPWIIADEDELTKYMCDYDKFAWCGYCNGRYPHHSEDCTYELFKFLRNLVNE